MDEECAKDLATVVVEVGDLGERVVGVEELDVCWVCERSVVGSAVEEVDGWLEW